MATYNIHVLVEQEIGQGEIAMNDLVLVQVEQTVDDLMHVEAGLVLGETALALEIGGELALLAQAQHQVDVVVVLEQRHELHDRRVLESIVDADLLVDALLQVLALGQPPLVDLHTHFITDVNYTVPKLNTTTHHLDRILFFRLFRLRFVDGGEAALAEQPAHDIVIYALFLIQLH